MNTSAVGLMFKRKRKEKKVMQIIINDVVRATFIVNFATLLQNTDDIIVKLFSNEG
jgi:hypothetical protein